MGIWIFQWIGVHVALALTPRASADIGDLPSGSGGGITIQNPLSCEEWSECIQGLLNGLAILAAPVVGIMILVGGFQLMSSGGDPEKVKKGRNTIVYSAVGYAVILLATAVAAVIQDAVSGS